MYTGHYLKKLYASSKKDGTPTVSDRIVCLGVPQEYQMICSIFLRSMVAINSIGNIAVLSTVILIGTHDYRRELDLGAWAYCYATQCCKAPDLYPEFFRTAAEHILYQDLHMAKCDITTANAKRVYLHLLSKFTGH